MSRPMRARGLKRGYGVLYNSRSHIVAPHAGAWIETGENGFKV